MRLGRSSIILGTFLYFIVCKYVFEAFFCSDRLETGDLTLYVDPAIVCFAPGHWATFFFACFLAAAFVIGMPLGFGVGVWWVHRHGKEDDEVVKRSFGYVYRGLRPEHRYYRLISFPIQALMALSSGIRK